MGGAQKDCSRAGKSIVAVMYLAKDTSVASIAMLQCVWPSASFLLRNAMLMN